MLQYLPQDAESGRKLGLLLADLQQETLCRRQVPLRQEGAREIDLLDVILIRCDQRRS
jgi:hypothetical protein